MERPRLSSMWGECMVVVTISGPSGSGKSTVARLIAEELKIPVHSAGAFFRKKAKEKKMDIKDFMEIAPKSLHEEADHSIDVASKKGNVVIEGRLSGFMASKANLRVYVTAPLEVRAKRIMDRHQLSLKEAKERLEERDKVDRGNYIKLYNIDVDDLYIYDLSINTEHFNAEETTKLIVTAVRLAGF